MDYTTTYDYGTTTATNVDSGVMAAIFAAMAGVWLVFMVIAVVMIVCMWKVFVKAGKPGWAAIIPVYNLIVLLEIAGRPAWWVILILFVPFANIVCLFIAYADIAKKFGKSGVWGVVMLGLLGIIGWPMLAFGKSEFKA